MIAFAELEGTARRRQFCAECPQADECLVRVLGDSESTRHCRVLHRGEPIFRAGEPLRAVYTLRSGAVKTRICSPAGQERVLGLHASGDLLGIDAMASGVHECDAVALDTVSVCGLSAAHLLGGQLGERWVGVELLRRLSRALAEQQRHVLALGHTSAEQRVAAFLLERSLGQQRLGLSTHRIHLPMARADIASYLALAVETVSRVLTRLQSVGVVAVHRSEIQVLDQGRLRAIANEPANGPASERVKERALRPSAAAA